MYFLLAFLACVILITLIVKSFAYAVRKIFIPLFGKRLLLRTKLNFLGFSKVLLSRWSQALLILLYLPIKLAMALRVLLYFDAWPWYWIWDIFYWLAIRIHHIRWLLHQEMLIDWRTKRRRECVKITFLKFIKQVGWRIGEKWTVNASNTTTKETWFDIVIYLHMELFHFIDIFWLTCKKLRFFFRVELERCSFKLFPGFKKYSL